MLGNGVKQTTATAGTGPLTLAAFAGAPRLVDVFGLNRPLTYSLVDEAGNFGEAGVGYLSAPNTLVRARISATYASGVYNASNPEPLNLSGNWSVIATPIASTLESMMPTVDAVSADALRYLTSANRTLNMTTFGPAAGLAVYTPFLLRASGPVRALAINVTSTVVGGAGQIALYACNENGYMGNLLYRSSTLDLSTPGLKVATIPAPPALAPGWYFTAFVGNSGNLRVSAHQSNASNVSGTSPLGLTASLQQIESRGESVSNTALPDIPSSSTTLFGSGSHPPIVLLGL